MNPHARLVAGLGGLPASYLVVDVETNGFQIDDDSVLPTQLGYLLVAGGEVVDHNAVVVDWRLLFRDLPGGAAIAAEFAERCESTERRMNGRGPGSCKVGLARVAAEGVDPRDAWPAYRDLVAGCLANGLPVVGHNILRFDCPLLSRTARNMDGVLDFPPDLVLDFGLFEAAVGLGTAPPAPGGLAAWYAAVGRPSSKVRWGLDHCVAKYGLAVDPATAHDAGGDVWSSHLLVEAYRSLAGEPWDLSAPATSTETR